MQPAGRDGRLTKPKWFDSPADYAAPPPTLVKCYTGGYTTVFGGWDDSLKAALAKAGPGSVELNDGMAGYLKDPAADAEGFKTGEMPMIWLSKRKIREGKMEQAATNFQKGVSRVSTCLSGRAGVPEGLTLPADVLQRPVGGRHRGVPRRGGGPRVVHPRLQRVRRLQGPLPCAGGSAPQRRARARRLTPGNPSPGSCSAW